MTEPLWSAPASAEVETEHARRVARALRAEAGLFAQRRDDYRQAGDHANARAMEHSRWTVIEQAARIERAVRGL